MEAIKDKEIRRRFETVVTEASKLVERIRQLEKENNALRRMLQDNDTIRQNEIH